MILSKDFAQSVKTAYDLRSMNFEPEDALLLGKSFGTDLVIKNKSSVCICHDRRFLSKKLYDFFIEGVISTGINVYKLGQVGTPVVQYMAIQKKIDAAVSVTASHNPIGYHGFKFFIDNKAFSEDNLTNLVNRCLEQKFENFEPGIEYDIDKDDYLNKLNSIKIEGKFNIGWDLLNGCGGDIIKNLSLQGKNIILNDQTKENFGNFPPDPNCIERLREIIKLEEENVVDFSFIIDGDADRTALLYKGKLISGDIFLAMLLYLNHEISAKKNKVVWDDISSLTIKKWSSQFSESFFSKTGHSNIQNLAIEKDCFIAGEMSGHYMFKDNYFIDDGLYSSLILLNFLERSNLSLESLLNLIPKTFLKKCKSIECKNSFDKIGKLDILKQYFKDQSIHFTEFDGIKVFLEYGCLIIRCSNTEPIIRVSIEGWTEKGLKNMDEFVEKIYSFLSKSWLK